MHLMTWRAVSVSPWLTVSSFNGNTVVAGTLQVAGELTASTKLVGR
jgi:hypothetical protein